MLASGAHVKIGSYEFRLSEEDQTSVSPGRTAYSYSNNLTEERLDYFTIDDWIGGEGNDAYDPNDPTVYHQGLVNPRNPGRITTPPTRSTLTSAVLTTAPSHALTAIAGGSLFVVGEDFDGAGATAMQQTTDLASLETEVASSGWGASMDYFTAVCSDGYSVYLVAYDSALSKHQIRRQKGSGAFGLTTIMNTLAIGSGAEIRCAGVLGNYIYLFDGTYLMCLNLTKSIADPTRTPVTRLTVGPSTTGVTWRTHYWTAMCNGQSAIYFLYATKGNTTVYQVTRSGAVFPIWSMPAGFTGKDITYQSGAIYVVGDNSGYSALYALSTVSKQPLFVGYLRYGSATSVDVINSGYGSEVIMSESSMASGKGRTWVYDAAQDSLSQLDAVELASGVTYSNGTFNGKRFIAVKDGTKQYLYSWATDDTPSTTVDGRMETGVYNFGSPEDEKILDGFHVLSDANATKTAQVYYQDNEDGTWTSAGTATTGFHNYLQVSDASATVPFRTLRFRVDPKTGASVYGVSARIRTDTYQEEWVLKIDLSDETVDRLYPRNLHNAQYRGWQLRDYLRTLATNKTIVTFLDGARYPGLQGDDPDKYSTHTVIVTIPQDNIEASAEGTMIVRLVSVAAT